MTTTFFRLLHAADKGAALADAIATLQAGQPADRLTYRADPQSLRQIPGSPFAYWVSEAVRRKFVEFLSLEDNGYVAAIGASTKNDFRYLRAWWETSHVLATRSREATAKGKRWVPFAKGGAFSPYYSDLDLTIDWLLDGRVLKEDISAYRTRHGWGTQWSAELHGHSRYFRPGLTWPRRTNGLSFRELPAGCIFADKCPAAFVDGDDHVQLLALAAIVNSRAFLALVQTMLARVELAQSFEVGLIQSMPVPNLDRSTTADLSRRVASCVELKRALDTANETSHAFTLPALLQVQGASLAERAAAWQARVEHTEAELARRQREIDDIAYRLYGIAEEDRRTIEASPHTEATEPAGGTGDDDAEEEVTPTVDRRALVAELFSYALGCAFGRWDVRIARDPSRAPALQGPFDPLPVCSPGMLVGPDGLPATSRDADYPLPIPWDGILVDDPDHPNDVVRRLRAVLEALWPEGADAGRVEGEASAILGVREAREYVAKSGGFFTDHLRRYSKSRRQAPICWPLSTASGAYTLWLYYHRLSSDTLFTAVNRYVDPKIEQVRRRAAEVRARLDTASGREATVLREQHDRAAAALGELEAFRAELLRVAALPYRPDLDDGAIINAAPLHALFRQREWAKATRECWRKLESGDYDWSHLAFALWPERVRQKCRSDKSLAIAHDREDWFQAPPAPTASASRRPGARERR